MESRPAKTEPRVSPLRAALCVVLFLAALSGGAVAIRAVVETQPGTDSGDNEVRSKKRFFSEHKDEYDVVMVGSSRVYRQILTTTFTETLAENGLEVTAFNFGIPAARLLETQHHLDWMLEQKPARLKWVILEVQEFNPEIKPENWLTPRVIAFHDLTTIDSVLGAGSAEWDDRKWDRSDHWAALLHGAFRFANVGTAVPLITAWLGSEDEDALEFALGKNVDGFLALWRSEDEDHVLRRQALLQKPETVGNLVRKMLSEKDPKETDEISLRLIWGMVDRIRAAGAEPILVMTTGYKPMHGLLHPDERGDLPNLLRYNRPRKYPKFYEAQNRFDSGHLNVRTSRQWTALLATEALPFMKD